MKCGVRMALGVGAGYLLGRTKKMKWALMLAGAGVTKKFGSPGELLQRGTKLLGSSAELGKITETVKGELVDALKGAAVTAATSRIDSLSDRLQERAGAAGKAPGQEEESEQPRDAARSRDEDEEDKDYAEGEDEEDRPEDEYEEGGEEPEEEEEERPVARRQASRTEGAEDEDDRMAARRREKVGAGSGRSPVRRTRR